MNADRWHRVQQAFEAVLADRTALSTIAADLREEIEQLLEQDVQAEREGFLTPPAGPRTLAGTRLGPYEVGEVVGTGGMGEVYRASRRDDYRQEVAIKVVRPGQAGDEGLERFRAERQALARLRHPNIARLLDGGTTPDGRPFLVMEFIAGPSLDRHAKDRPLKEKVSLFRDVCLAVAHAHAAGVIHRDLKPGNILVGSDGVPRVTDFGLARQAEDSRVTAAGQVIGTPSYMAPEQAKGGAVGPAADVYALGAILYELLTGRPPFRGETPRATMDQVLNTDPLAPRLLQPGLPRDVETICLKCLQKDPARRYASASDLADDVGRFLAGEPIRARPVGRAERILRWSRHNPGVAALSAALVLAVVGGFVGVTLLWLEADRQRGRAERRERLARAAADDLLRVAARTMDYLPRMSDDQLAALERSLESYLELNRDSPDDAIRFRAAQAHHFVARLHRRFGRLEKAEASYRAQLALLEALPPERRVRFDTFHALLALRSCLADRPAEARQLAERGLALIRSLAEDHPDEPIYADALAHEYFRNGLMESAEGNDARAEESFRRGVAVAQDLVCRHPGRTALPDFRCNVFNNVVGLARIHCARGQRDEAIRTHRRAVEVIRAVADTHPTEPEYRLSLANTLGESSSLLDAAGDPGADALAAEAVELMRKPAADFPGLPLFREALARNLYQRAWQRRDAALFREALSAYEAIHRDFPGHAGTLASVCSYFPLPGLADPARARRLTAESTGSSERLVHAIACLELGDAPAALARVQGVGRDNALGRHIVEGLARHACRDRAGAAACLARAEGDPQCICLPASWRYLLERLRAAMLSAGDGAERERQP